MWYIGDVLIVERVKPLVVNSIVWTTLALIAISLRLFTRAFVIKKLGVDDWLMTGAMVFSIATLVSIMYQIKYGLGQPVNLATLVNFLAALYTTVPCYNMAQLLYKLSFTTQSYRVFTTPKAQRIMKLLISWIIVCGIMAVTLSLVYCIPISKSWDDSVPGSCANRSNIHYSIAAFNILNDVMLLCIPVPFLVALQIQQRQRIILIAVFACGACVTVVSILRLKALYDNLSGPIDLQPVTGVDIALWSHLEINVAIICGSVPALKAFISRVVLKRPSLYYAGSSTQSNGLSSKPTSQVMRSKADRSKPDPDMQITVEQSIEMKSFDPEDGGSEKELIATENFSPAIRNTAMISGAGASQSQIGTAS